VIEVIYDAPLSNAACSDTFWIQDGSVHCTRSSIMGSAS
jgi:hypothetical protein